MKINRNLIIHCSDTYPDQDIGAEDITRWHVQERGWAAIGYHYVIRRDGRLELGRDLDGDGNIDEEVGAHALGHNADSIGVCLIGGRGRDEQPDDNFNPDQFNTLGVLVNWMRVRYPGIAVFGHCDVSDKTCPNFDVKQRYG